MSAISATWTRLPALVRALLSAFVVLLLAQLTTLGILGNLKFHTEVPWALPATLILLTAFWLIVSGKRSSWRASVTRGNPMPAAVRQAALVSIVFAFISLIALRLLLPSVLPVAAPSFAVDISTLSPLVVTGLALSIAVSAGVTEEVVFRGYLQKQLEDAYGIVPAIAVAGFCFWLAHTDKATITHLPFHMMASVFLGLLAYLSRSLWPSIIAHTAGDAFLVPAYAFHQPSFAWSALSARPIWEGGDADTLSERAALVLRALEPANLYTSGPHQTFAILTATFLIAGLLTIWSLAHLGKVARAAR
jgi:membrane protease YdiL (CAAX protease family)